MAVQNQDLTWMAWSKKDNILAVGTSKGNLMLYNDDEKRKVHMHGSGMFILRVRVSLMSLLDSAAYDVAA